MLNQHSRARCKASTRWIGILAVADLIACTILAIDSSPATAQVTTPIQVTASAQAPLWTSTGGGIFHSIPKSRLLDTRSAGGPVTSGSVLKLTVGGMAGVPLKGASAVSLHVSVIDAEGSGTIVVYPDGVITPQSSTVSYSPRQASANSAFVVLPASGVINILNTGAVTQIAVDVAGWFSSGIVRAGGFTPLTSRRLLDTRLTKSPLRSLSTLSLKIASAENIPATVQAVALNITATGSSGPKPLVVWATGTPRPVTTDLTATPGSAVTALVIAKLGTAGAISIGSPTGFNTDLVIDLAGYFTAGPAASGGFQAVTPTRLIDTRTTGTPILNGAPRAVQVASHAAVPYSASAAIVNITGPPSAADDGNLVVWQGETAQPTTWDINLRTNAPVTRQLIVPLDHTGQFSLANSAGASHAIIDIVGYLTGTPVKPINWAALSRDGDNLLTSPAAIQARTILNTANRYAVVTWWPTAAQILLKQPMGTNQQADASDSVRRLSMVAFSLAVSLKTGAYDPTATGVSAVRATSIAVALVTAVTSRHISNRPNGWGASWQSSMWSSYAGRAGWLLWEAMPAQLQTAVQNMTIFEANYVATLAPKYSTASNGDVESAGDTGGEEDAWYALAPGLALAMMPDAPQTPLWQYKEQQMLIAAWAKPSDLTSSALVDGASLSSWLQGTNVAESGMVANHNRIAPDYSTNLYQSVDTLFMATLAGQPAPQASLQGLRAVYTALSTASYAIPKYLAPGGQIYSNTTSNIYYPQGCDWGTGQQLPYALIDTEAKLFGFGDPAASAGAESLHAGAQLAMQARSRNGATFTNNTEYIYKGREEHTNQLAAQMYLAYFVKVRTTTGTVSRPPTPSVMIPSGRIPAAQNESIYRR